MPNYNLCFVFSEIFSLEAGGIEDSLDTGVIFIVAFQELKIKKYILSDCSDLWFDLVRLPWQRSAFLFKTDV